MLYSNRVTPGRYIYGCGYPFMLLWGDAHPPERAVAITVPSLCDAGAPRKRRAVKGVLAGSAGGAGDQRARCCTAGTGADLYLWQANHTARGKRALAEAVRRMRRGQRAKQGSRLVLPPDHRWAGRGQGTVPQPVGAATDGGARAEAGRGNSTYTRGADQDMPILRWGVCAQRRRSTLLCGTSAPHRWPDAAAPQAYLPARRSV